MRFPLSWNYFLIRHLPCEYFVKIIDYSIIQNNRSKLVRNDFMHIMKSPYIISKHVKKAHLKKRVVAFKLLKNKSGMRED